MSDKARTVDNVTESHPHYRVLLSYPEDEFKSLCCRMCNNICANACLCQECQLPYCESCVDEAEECSCGNSLDEDSIVNVSVFFETILKDVDTECGYSDCEFQGKFPVVLDHVKVCPCREYTCPECEEEMQHRDAEEHTKECVEAKVECPNKCKVATMARKDLANHEKVCKRRPVSCRFAKNGCDFKGDFKSYMHHLVDCAFDAPADHKRKVDEVEEESDEEAKPLKKRKIIPEEEVAEPVVEEKVEEAVEQVEEVATEPAEPSRVMEVLLQNAPMVVEEVLELDEEDERGDAPEPDENASSEEDSEDEREPVEESPVAQTPEDAEEDAEGQDSPRSPEKEEEPIVAPSAGIFSKIRKIVSSMSSGNLETLAESVEQAM